MDYKLDSVVKEYLIETGDTQMNKYARYFTHAVSGLREFNLNASGVIRTISMPIKVDDTCDLPADYIQYTKIGFVGTNGQLYALGLNSNLSLLPGFDDCGSPIPLDNTTSNNRLSSSFVGRSRSGSHYRNGEFMGRLFGVHGGINPYGDFRIDRENRQIIIGRIGIANETTRTTEDGQETARITNQVAVENVVMEYIADIRLVDKDFEVHPFIVEALKSWMFYKSIERNITVNLGEKDRAKINYYNEERKAKNRFNSHTIKEWTAAFRRGNTASVKF